MNNPIYKNKVECTGCRLCSEVCPKQCIHMEKDNEGFVYPIIDESVCIDCRKCIKTCPSNGTGYHQPLSLKAGVHTPSEVKASASGGAFWALCQILIPQGFVVAGVAWDDNFHVVHKIAYTLEEAQAFRKSKYVASNTNGIFQQVKKLIKGGRKVLFTGTPCQVAACKNFVGDNENLLLVDLICHGVPNQDIFDKEVSYLESKYGGKLQSFSFKQKEPVYGIVNSRSAEYTIKNKTYRVVPKDDPYLQGYYSRLYYRPSCGNCHYTQVARVGDITIGDAWDIEKIYNDINSLSGVSLVLFNTQKGLNLLPSIQGYMDLRAVTQEWAVKANAQLREPTTMHKNRSSFFVHFDSKPFARNVAQCTHRSFILRVYKKLITKLRLQ